MKGFKKIVSVTAAVVMAIVAAMSLVSCNPDNSGNGNGQGSESAILKKNPHLTEAIKNFSGTIELDDKCIVAATEDLFTGFQPQGFDAAMTGGFIRVMTGGTEVASEYAYYDFVNGFLYMPDGSGYQYGGTVTLDPVVDGIERAIRENREVKATRDGANVYYDYSLDFKSEVSAVVDVIAKAETESAYDFVNDIIAVSGLTNDDGTDLTLDNAFDLLTEFITATADWTFSEFTSALDVVLSSVFGQFGYDVPTLYALIETSTGIPLYEVYLNHGDKTVSTIVGALATAMTSGAFNQETFEAALEKTYSAAELKVALFAVKNLMTSTLINMKAQTIIEMIPEPFGELVRAMMVSNSSVESFSFMYRLALTDGIISEISLSSKILFSNNAELVTIAGRTDGLEVVHELLSNSNIMKISFMQGQAFTVPDFTVTNKVIGERYVYVKKKGDKTDLQISKFTGKTVSNIAVNSQPDEVLPGIRLDGETIAVMSDIDELTYSLSCTAHYTDGTSEDFIVHLIGNVSGN